MSLAPSWAAAWASVPDGSNARIRWAEGLWGVRRQEHAARVEHVAYVCDLSCRTDPAVGRAGGPDSRTIEFCREFPLSAHLRYSRTTSKRLKLPPCRPSIIGPIRFGQSLIHSHGAPQRSASEQPGRVERWQWRVGVVHDQRDLGQPKQAPQTKAGFPRYSAHLGCYREGRLRAKREASDRKHGLPLRAPSPTMQIVCRSGLTTVLISLSPN